MDFSPFGFFWVLKDSLLYLCIWLFSWVSAISFHVSHSKLNCFGGHRECAKAFDGFRVFQRILMVWSCTWPWLSWPWVGTMLGLHCSQGWHRVVSTKSPNGAWFAIKKWIWFGGPSGALRAYNKSAFIWQHTREPSYVKECSHCIQIAPTRKRTPST